MDLQKVGILLALLGLIFAIYKFVDQDDQMPDGAVELADQRLEKSHQRPAILRS